MLALLFVLLQAGAPTVGDTIWVTRTVIVPPGREVRPADWQLPEGDVERLGDPRVTRRASGVEIGYPIVVWRPGRHTLEIPGPVLLAADGAVDSLPAESVTVSVASVLPPVPPESAVPPQPRAGIIPRRVTDPRPLVVLWAAAAVLLVPVHLLWRRRGVRTAVAQTAAVPVEPPIDHWADAGEYRAVIAAAATRVRRAVAAAVPGAHEALDTEAVLAVLAQERPVWPLGELGDLLRALDEARFAAPVFPDAVGLHRWAAELAERLGATP